MNIAEQLLGHEIMGKYCSSGLKMKHGSNHPQLAKDSRKEVMGKIFSNLARQWAIANS